MLGGICMINYSKEDIMKWVDPSDNNISWESSEKEHEEPFLRKIKRLFINKKEDILFEIKYFWNNTILDPIYETKTAITNFWKYRKIIAKDRWWDYQFIFNLLEFKLKDMIKNWDNAHYVGSDFTKKRMQVILNRIEEYQTNLENLQELHYMGKISREEYLVQKNKLIDKTWKTFGRNITRFWD